MSEFLQNIIRSDTSYYAIADAFRVLTTIDSISAKKHVDDLLNTESHNDVIRKAHSLFWTCKNRNNYNHKRAC